MNKPIVLTGIKPTGHPHLGNYIGAIKPALEMAKNSNLQGMYFIADYHALNAIQNSQYFRNFTYEIAAAWLALGLDPENVIFYRQSDIPEILELHWILSCLTPKGLMNRAHAYKGKINKNREEGIDIDHGINMGLYTYPILMASDILMFQSNFVPVGKDQIQHVEIARDIASYFNHTYGETFSLPEYIIQENTEMLPGLDGRKMSKSYGNVIPLFEDPSKLKKLIFKIKTDSTLPTEPKDHTTSPLFALYKEFATSEEIEKMKEHYQTGIGWGQVKQEVFDVVNRELEQPRKKYHMYMENLDFLQSILHKGASRAREKATIQLQQIKSRIGC
ncbi:tryptophan--tRNA ligase [Bacillus cytotoxicus]|uniref:Tryptophan--tRNA ligase n=1 Tax=Bacillus cytotoxicus (strain DSM 22905 / CIP 110041 / 391-98 / NVH 391-98) TaxID=315749 RepID=A7GR55_BACCN|nr:MULTISPECIES: tryptophan--tRNA ligase [Bacillus cereus group]ABS22613.1 tryptophanyl-tRNA synthetase [Bacillus cytotoxicus NVH 391-98]AWC45257.1 tryptophan--tRNA ligase [Bacillus cytotoxicus]MDH2865691.1 tryptophan--tRNA ligase [Bacillus cytotoxicus]MDH2885707.1 tryptophan--tRNA ligase [Bacillus cytotoxicus]NZD34222.1 tryptophan--tRNA ligase [Bacillus cytotoxicus]